MRRIGHGLTLNESKCPARDHALIGTRLRVTNSWPGSLGNVPLIPAFWNQSEVMSQVEGKKIASKVGTY